MNKNINNCVNEKIQNLIEENIEINFGGFKIDLDIDFSIQFKEMEHIIFILEKLKIKKRK